MASVDPLKPGFAVKDIQRLRNMVPIHTLPEAVFADLLQDLRIDAVAKNELLMKEGDTEQLSYYLLEGHVSLLEGGDVVDTVEAGEESARFPIAHVLPRKNSVRADSRVRVACIDTRRISELLARNHQVTYEVDHLEEPESDDWMSLLLRSPVLQQLPASNIQRVMMSVTEVEVEQGEEIIRQGDPGDFFYMLVHGHALVTRDEGDGTPPQELAQLGPGNAFGEEALLSDNPRNSTITMKTPGQVLRLAKDDFLELVQSPLARPIDFDQAVQKVEAGAVWIDLRPPEEYEQDHFPGSVNFPIESLRYQLSSLATERHYVLYSNSGERAAVAAYLMIDQGFEVSLLKGGLKRLREEQPEASLPEVGAGDGSKESSELQRRVQEAELRAHELERQLRKAEASVQDAEQEKEQHLQELKGTVDSTRERLRTTEEEKQAALADAQKAYSEMEELTTNLEKLTSERTALADRMREIEGLDQKLQSRLLKVERELIGERERAESAVESLDDINDRLSEVMRERELERQQHDLERGELKEEVTCLQLELEQATMELEEVRALEPSGAAPTVTAPEAVQGEPDPHLAVRIESLEQEATRNAALLVEREAEVASLTEQLTAVQAHNGDLLEQVVAYETTVQEEPVPKQQNEAQVAQLEQALAGAQSDLAKNEALLHAAEQEREEMLNQLAQRQSEVTELRAVMEAHVEQIRSAREAHLLQEEDQRDWQALEAQLEAVRKELREARERIAGAPDAADVEAMRQELHDVQCSLKERQNDLVQAEETRHKLEDVLEDTHAELDRLRLELERVSAKLSEAEAREKQAGENCARLEHEIEQLQQHAVELDLNDIKEDGGRFGSRPLDVDALGGGGWLSRLVPVTVGAAAVLLLMEALSFFTGRGELFSFLFK